MFDPISKTWHFNSAALWIDFALSLIVIVGLLVVVINAAKRTVYTIASIASAVVSIFAWFFGLTFLWQVTLMFMTAFLAAVVIHGNEIVAASVFFTPTTKPFAGKYGSRHRAAIGISEVSDAITVVVSEETGRISFAVNGDLEAVNQTNFLRVFENYMADHSSEE